MASGVARADDAGPFAQTAIADSLDRYIAFGGKQSGGAGDTACGAWMEATLASAGFQTTRQIFDAPCFDAKVSTLTIDGHAIPVLPLAPVVTTDTVQARLVVRAPGVTAPVRGAIVVAPLPHRRWSTSESREVSEVIDAAARDGAAAVLLVTHGPTGAAIALNADPRRAWPVPVGIIAPREVAPIYATAASQRGSGVLIIRGVRGVRPAFNVVGTLVRSGGPHIVISTPRSGWTVCGGERGGGVAVWRALAQWAPRALPAATITMLCTSGHEYENLGGETFLRSDLAPRPAQTHLWAHLGAAVAARDWHEAGDRLAPLPSVDPQRFLMASADLLPDLAAIFRGAPGLEHPYAAQGGAAGELGNILAAGYPRLFGILGAHRYHHVDGDDARCVDAGQVCATAAPIRDAVLRLGAQRT